MFKIKVASIIGGFSYFEASRAKVVWRYSSEFNEYVKKLLEVSKQDANKCVAILSYRLYTYKHSDCIIPIWHNVDLYIDGEHLCNSADYTFEGVYKPVNTVNEDAADNTTIQPKHFTDERYGAYIDKRDKLL